MNVLQDIYDEAELDDEWTKYLESLNEKKVSLRVEEHRKSERADRKTMDDLKKHIRGLSMLRLEMEVDNTFDSMEDSSDSSDSELSSSDTIKINDTPCDDLDFSSDDGLSDVETIDTTTITMTTNSDVTPTGKTPIGLNAEKSFNTSSNRLMHIGALCPVNNDIEDSQDSDEDSELETEEDSDDDAGSVNMEELEKLKKELSLFDKKNETHSKRTKSQEEVLLSVLNINQNSMDEVELQNITQTAINEYNEMQEKAKKEVIITIKHRIRNKSFCLDNVSLTNLMSPLPEKPIECSSGSPATLKLRPSPIKLCDTYRVSSNSGLKPSSHGSYRHLADPYQNEWTGLEPDDYDWFDDQEEGECTDDRILSLRNRRLQYLILMGVENKYLKIKDLSNHQANLLWMYEQQMMNAFY